MTDPGRDCDGAAAVPGPEGRDGAAAVTGPEGRDGNGDGAAAVTGPEDTVTGTDP